MLDYLLTNLPEDALSDLEPADSDWESKGVLRHFWQPSFEDDFMGMPGWIFSEVVGWRYWHFNPTRMSPMGYIFYPQ